MKQRRYRVLVAAVVVCSVCTASASDQTQDEPPSESIGVSSSDSVSLPLGAQIPAMEGYRVRAQTITMATGAVIALHSHTNRPGGYYVVRGDRVVEHRGDRKTVVSPGTIVLESKDVEHWVINEGSEALFFVFDIVPMD